MLKYQRKGFLPGVPARDLLDEEIRQWGKKRLIDSGLYVEVREKKTRTKQIDKEPETEHEQAEE